MRLEIRGGFPAFLVLLCSIVPKELRIAYLAAAVCHELGHILAARLMSGRVESIRLGFADVHMVIRGLDYRQELLCALAGPGVQFALCAIFRQFPVFAACCLILGVYNLLPILPLDGGRVLENALLLYMEPDRAERICRICAIAVCGVLLVFGGIQAICRKNALVLAAAVSVSVRWAQNPVAIWPFSRYNNTDIMNVSQRF